MQPGRHRSEVAPAGCPRQRVQAQAHLPESGSRGVVRHPPRERDALCGRTIELELFHGPGAAHHVPAVGGALRRVHQQRSQGAAARRLFQLVGPAPVVRQRATVENRRVLETGIVDEHEQHLAAHVRVLVVVPLPLRGPDAIAHEDHFAVRHDVALRPLRPGDEVVQVLEGVRRAAPAPDQRRTRCHPDQRHRLEIRSVGGPRLEPHRLELRGDVLDRQASAAGGRRSPLELVVGEILEVRVHCGRARRKRVGGGRGGEGGPHQRRRGGAGGGRGGDESDAAHRVRSS